MSTDLTSRFDEAVAYAHAAHRDRERWGAPMLGHLLEVAAVVIQNGGSEEEAIAALLHDAAEDAGGTARLAAIRERFGDAVADIVEQCTDSFEEPRPSWRERKRRYVEHLPEASGSALLVSTADKLCNVRRLIADLHDQGAAAWKEYKGGCDGRLWYYNALVEVFAAAGGTAIFPEYARAVEELCTVA